MTKLRDQKGAITMITLITVLFLVSFLMSTYIIISNKVKTQKEMLNETKSIYETKVTMEEIYNSYFSNDAVIPIYTVNQLLAIGNDEKINIDGKIYTFTNTEDVTYVLKNDLEFNALDLGLQGDWIPPYENTELLANFDWNGHTIEVTTLSGNIISYDGTYLNTVTGYPIILANSISSNLVDYKIYGNSIQEGTPTPETPIEVKNVGDLVTDEIDSNYGKYRIPVKVSGKNLVSELKGGYTSTTNFPKIDAGGSKIFQTIVLKNLKAGTYTFSFEKPINVVRSVSTSSHSSNISIRPNVTSNTKVVTITLTQDEEEYHLSFRDSTSASTEWDGWVQCEKGGAATAYEQYKEQKYNIYLDEPLRKIGDYADYIDFENKKVVRNISKTTIDQNSSFGKFSAVTDYAAFYFAQSDIGYIEVKSPTFKYHKCYNANTNTSWSDDYQIGGSIATTYNRICFTLPNTITSTTEAKTWLAENPIEVLYCTNKISEETIELPDIQLYKGINTITVDTDVQPSNMSITYNVKQ